MNSTFSAIWIISHSHVHVVLCFCVSRSNAEILFPLRIIPESLIVMILFLRFLFNSITNCSTFLFRVVQQVASGDRGLSHILHVAASHRIVDLLFNWKCLLLIHSFHFVLQRQLAYSKRPKYSVIENIFSWILFFSVLFIIFNTYFFFHDKTTYSSLSCAFHRCVQFDVLHFIKSLCNLNEASLLRSQSQYHQFIHSSAKPELLKQPYLIICWMTML